MLIPFPIGFLIGALLFDLLGLLLDSPGFWVTGSYLATAGIVAGLLAAIPGLVDYLFTVPPGSSARSRGTRHMLTMIGVLVLFGTARIIRGDPETRPETVVIILELLAAGALGGGAWLGGTLVLRNFIGPDHRHAGAGKWKEETLSATEGAIRVADSDELKPNQMKLVHIGDRRLVIGRSDSGYVAFDDACTHRGGSLADGVMICDTVHCLWHGSQFDVRTGVPKAGPAKEKIGTYRVEEREGGVFVVLG